MKYTKICSLLAMGLALTACDDLFEPAKENINDIDMMYTDASYAQGLLGNAYILLPYSSEPGTDMATDDAVCNNLSNDYVKMATGSWTSQSDPTSQWKNRLNAIQYINIVLANADKVNFSVDPKLQLLFVDLFKGDALGMRALQNFYLLRAHAGMVDGQMMGVPVLTEYQDANADFNQPRNTFKECIDAIMDDIKSAMELLPYNYVDVSDDEVPAKYKSMGIGGGTYNRAFGGHQKGKICGQILQALRAQVALYAASPAFAQYSEMSMNQAAQYAAEVIGKKELVPNGNAWFADKTEIKGLAKGANAAESIWQSNVEERLSHEQNFFPPSLFGNGLCNPTQNLVDAFPMANGYPINNPNSGYDPANPYEGRDNRLASYIVYDNSKLGSATIVTGTYKENNVDGLNHTQGASTRTGYYMKKFLRDDVNLNSANQTKQMSYDARIRYTEIFLAFAEAANEAVGPTGNIAGTTHTAKSIIREIRKRAGICVDTEDPYLEECAASKETMRELIRNERRLELCFENHRFYDLRRWQVDLNKLNETAKGAQIAVAGQAFQTIDVEPRKYESYQFYGPIPYSEIMKFNALKQNDGWK